MRTLCLAATFVLSFTDLTHEIIIVREGDMVSMRKLCDAYFRWEQLAHDRVDGLYDRCAYVGMYGAR